MRTYVPLLKSTLLQNDKSPGTIGTYLKNIRLFADYISQTYDEPFNPIKVTTLDIKEYRNFLLNVQSQSVNTINNKLASLSKFFKFLHKSGVVTNNPCLNIKKIKMQSPVKRVIVDQLTFKKLRREVERDGRPVEKVIIAYLFYTGVRVSELINIRLDDIVINPRSGTLKIRSGKGLKYREIPLNASVRDATNGYLEYRKIKKIQSPYLIVTERSGKSRASRSSINKILKKYGKRIGFPDISPHSARRYFLTQILAVSSLSVAKELAGHSNINTTILYTPASQQEKEIAVSKLTNDSKRMTAIRSSMRLP